MLVFVLGISLGACFGVVVAGLCMSLNNGGPDFARHPSESWDPAPADH